MIRFAHVGDLHYWSISYNPWEYRHKRLLGMGNLILRRRKKFRKELSPILFEKLADLSPEWVLFSGDFSTTSTTKEFETARASLTRLDESIAGKIRLIPGNHDRYGISDHKTRKFEKHLGAWCEDGKNWPWFQELGDGLWTVGIDATVWNRMGSHGEIRKETCEALSTFLEQNNPAALLILCHFPAEDPPGVLKHDRGIQLRAAQPLLDLIGASSIPTYYLHGHHHYRWIYHSPSHSNLKYCNAGAPMMRHGVAAPDLGFYEFSWNGSRLSLTLHTTVAITGEWSNAEISLSAEEPYLDLQHPASNFA